MACGFQYEIPRPPSPSAWLGCTQFSGWFVRNWTRFAAMATRLTIRGWPDRDYQVLDLRVRRALSHWGIPWAEHGPPVGHVHNCT